MIYPNSCNKHFVSCSCLLNTAPGSTGRRWPQAGWSSEFHNLFEQQGPHAYKRSCPHVAFAFRIILRPAKSHCLILHPGQPQQSHFFCRSNLMQLFPFSCRNNAFPHQPLLSRGGICTFAWMLGKKHPHKTAENLHAHSCHQENFCICWVSPCDLLFIYKH